MHLLIFINDAIIFSYNEQQANVREQETHGARAACMLYAMTKHQFKKKSKQLAEHH